MMSEGKLGSRSTCAGETPDVGCGSSLMRVCLHPKFPDNREKNRENRKMRAETSTISS
jgi:hypothetical protein